MQDKEVLRDRYGNRIGEVRSTISKGLARRRPRRASLLQVHVCHSAAANYLRDRIHSRESLVRCRVIRRGLHTFTERLPVGEPDDNNPLAASAEAPMMIWLSAKLSAPCFSAMALSFRVAAIIASRVPPLRTVTIATDMFSLPALRSNLAAATGCARGLHLATATSVVTRQATFPVPNASEPKCLRDHALLFLHGRMSSHVSIGSRNTS